MGGPTEPRATALEQTVRELREHWGQFETGFWEAEVSFGRVRQPRSSLFLNHWLISRTGEEIVAREVFTRFKQLCDHEIEAPIQAVVAQIAAAARVYRGFVESAAAGEGPIDRLGLFAYRVETLENEVVKPVVLALLDPSLPPVPKAQIDRAIAALESWLVRRMLIRASTNAYNKLTADMVIRLLRSDRDRAGDVIHDFLKGQDAESAYWPDDSEVRAELEAMPAYLKLRQPRLRMVLEAVEDHRRGWTSGKEGLGGSRVMRGRLAIEHLLPRQWEPHWPTTSPGEAAEREALLHTIGNLTLLTRRLNSAVSNGPWDKKAQALREHDTLKLNMDLLTSSPGGWDDARIRRRTEALLEAILQIWPVPPGHVSPFQRIERRARRRISLADLLGAGLIQPGQQLIPRGKKFRDLPATVLPDGSLDLQNQTFATPSAAATHLTGRSCNGWDFFYLDRQKKRRLLDLGQEYEALTSVDEAESDFDDEPAPG